MKLMGKLFINGVIKALTGLHIGGSKTDVAIGDIDNSVIKTVEGIPYIPGSSLKGKIRSLLEKRDKFELCQCGSCDVCVIFGVSAAKNSGNSGPTRLIVRDSFLTETTKRHMEERAKQNGETYLVYTETKWENLIHRLTSKAQHPRQMERVPQGAEFEFQLIYNLLEPKDVDRLDTLFEGLNLLQDDYLGGSGSRGYGRIEFTHLQIGLKTIEDYEGENQMHVLYDGSLKDFSVTERDTFKSKLREKLGVEKENEGL